MNRRLYDDVFTDAACADIANVIVWPQKIRAGAKAYVRTFDGAQTRDCCTRSFAEVECLIRESFASRRARHLVVVAKKLVEDYVRFVFSVLFDVAPDAQIVFINCLYDHSMFTQRDAQELVKLPNRIVGCFATQLSDSDVLPPHGSPWRPTLLPIGILNDTPVWCNALKTDDGRDAPGRLLYVNISVEYTCFTRASMASYERRTALEKILANGFALSTRVPHHVMLQKMSEHAFCACPRGIGPDTHRFWEALAVGCIPVMTDWRRLRHAYRGQLPALFVLHSKFESSFHIHNLRSFEMCPGVVVDECGDVLCASWEHVTPAGLPRAYRFVAWKRYRPVVRSLLYKGTWMAKIHACFT